MGGIAAETGFTMREIESLDAAGLRFWWNAIMAFHQRVRDESQS